MIVGAVVLGSLDTLTLVDDPDAQRVRAGYQLRINAGEASAQPVPVDVSQALAWLHHKIVFEQRPLGEVAEEFNRYARIPVVIARLIFCTNFDS